jgi:hypothetical protein
MTESFATLRRLIKYRVIGNSVDGIWRAIGPERTLHVTLLGCERGEQSNLLVSRFHQFTYACIGNLSILSSSRVSLIDASCNVPFWAGGADRAGLGVVKIGENEATCQNGSRIRGLEG